MRRSAAGATLCAALLLSCGASKSPAARAADEALEAYRASPSSAAYATFVNMNGVAAREHGRPADAVGVEYRLRLIEVQSEEAQRSRDVRLAEEVTTAVEALQKSAADDNLDEALPGAKKRLEAAKRRAEHVN